HYSVWDDADGCVGRMVQAAGKRVARCRRAVSVRLVERSARRRTVLHVLILVYGVIGGITRIPGQGSLERTAGLDFEGAEASADVTAATKPRRRGCDQVAAWACMNAVGCRLHHRGSACMIDATPERVASSVGDLAGSYRERRARSEAMRH